MPEGMEVATPVVNTPNTPSTPPANGQDSAKVEGAATPAQPKPEQQMFEVKVNGSIRKMTLEQLKSEAAMFPAARERFEQSAKREKAAYEKEEKYNAWKEKAQKNAIEALMDPELGLTKDQIRTRFEQWYKEEFIDPETLTPEQQEITSLKKYREQKEREEAEREEMSTKQREEAETAQASEKLQTEIIGMLERSDLPKTRFTLGRMVYFMRQNIARGYDAPEEVIIQKVRAERDNVVRSLVEAATPDQVVGMLGPEVIKKLRAYDMASIQKKLEGGSTPTPSSKPNEKREPKTYDDFNAYMRSIRQMPNRR